MAWIHCLVPLGRVPGVGRRNQFGVDLDLCPPHSPGGFDTADGFAESPVNQPVTGRHRSAVIEEGGVSDDHRDTRSGSDRDIELPVRLAPEQTSNDLAVLGRQRQNSRVSRTRPHSPGVL